LRKITAFDQNPKVPTNAELRQYQVLCSGFGKIQASIVGDMATNYIHAAIAHFPTIAARLAKIGMTTIYGASTDRCRHSITTTENRARKNS